MVTWRTNRISGFQIRFPLMAYEISPMADPSDPATDYWTQFKLAFCTCVSGWSSTLKPRCKLGEGCIWSMQLGF